MDEKELIELGRLVAGFDDGKPGNRSLSFEGGVWIVSYGQIVVVGHTALEALQKMERRKGESK